LGARAVIGLGCMRLSTDADRDEARAMATLDAALEAGVALFDTARAYGRDDADAGHNERLVARALSDARARGGDVARVRVVTKCGMRRPDGAWVTDGRARTIAADLRASADAIGRPPDVAMLHAPDPRTPLVTSVRALARARADGVVRAIGLSNVGVTQLEEALRIVPVAAVEVALGGFDDAAARGGLVRFCRARGIEVLAHSPLGGPARAWRLAGDAALAEIAREVGATAIEVVLAYLCAIGVVPLAGARRPETIASIVAASRVALDERALARLDARFPGLALARQADAKSVVASSGREVVLVMGVVGAGKSRAAAEYVARGYERLNRDDAGGTLRALAQVLDERLRAGAERVVLDNTYLSRASRSDVLEVARRHGARVGCVLLETPAPDAQANIVLRMLARYGRLLEPEEMTRAPEPNMVRPTVLFRMLRELEPPSEDEGFASIEARTFTRAPSDRTRIGAIVAIEALASDDALAVVPPDAPCLVLAWRPGATDAWLASARARIADLAAKTGRTIELGVCAHGAGPPVCWCRPPLPGLWLAFAEKHAVATHGGLVVATSAAHGTLARALGMDVHDRSA
jgi:aryl-alcohol dehydrogenase-like predicted oxidoreductase